MKDIEELLYEADFSKDTDLKERLWRILSSMKAATSEAGGNNSKIRSFPFRKLEDEELDYVNAARGVWLEDAPHKKEED